MSRLLAAFLAAAGVCTSAVVRWFLKFRELAAMASPQPSSSSPPPPAPTTISALNDDLLREIFLRLPAVTSLARAAFSCRAFLRAVRSSPAFRRRFRELHAPPLVAFFLVPYMRAFVPAAGGGRSFEARAFADLLRDDDASVWCTEFVHSDEGSAIPYIDGYVCFTNRTTDQCVAYSPHSQALQFYPKKPHDGDETCLELHMLSPDAAEERPSRVVCVHHECSWAWARVAVFSSHTREWDILPETGTLLPEGDRHTIATVVSGFVCWVHKEKGCILALSTETFQFSRMDLPSPLKFPFQNFMLGQTKDGKLCIVDAYKCKLFVWLWTVEDGVERFKLHKLISLHAAVKELTERPDVDNANVRLMTITNGFVYLSVFCWKSQSSDYECFLSICLETAEVNVLLKEGSHWPCPVHPYIMTTWPSSLTRNKQDSETGATGGISEDDGPMATGEVSPVLLTALHSFKETLIDDDKVNFMKMDAFLLDDEMNSLVNRITALESGLAAARDSILRLCGDSDNRKEMESSSWWQMWTARLGRACSQFFAS